MKNLTDENFWNHRWAEKYIIDRPWLVAHCETVRVLRNVLQYIPSEGRVLELGIAPGKMVKKYFELRQDLIYDGLDISDIGIRETEKIYHHSGINGSLYRGDLRDHNLKLGNQYDLVCSHGLVEHFNEFEEIIAHHFKYATRKGIVFITTPNYNQPLIKLFLNRFSHETISSHNFAMMSIEALTEAINKAGQALLYSGRYGGAILPHSVVNPDWKGLCYRYFCRTWNASVSAVTVMTFNKFLLRLWESNFFIVARKVR